MKVKPSILLLVQLPPPIHGASIVNQTIVTNSAIAEELSLHVINITTAEELADIGKMKVSKYTRFLVTYWEIVRILRKSKFDLVYLTLSPHGLAFVKDSILALTAKLFRQKLVLHLHGKGIADRIHDSRVKAWLYRFVFRGVDVIHLSPVLYDDIQEIVPQDSVYFLGNGVENQKIEAEKKHESVRILYLSNLVPAKGAQVLLEAARKLAEKGYTFVVDYVGAWGNDKRFNDDFIDYIRDNHFEEFVRIHGPKYGQEKQQFLNTADVFVLPTYFKNECFPLAILEAMSCGLAVVSTHEGAIPDIVDNGRTGLLVTQRSVEELAAALERLINSKDLREQLGNAAEKKYQNCFTVDSFERNYIATIRKILGKGDLRVE